MLLYKDAKNRNLKRAIFTENQILKNTSLRIYKKQDLAFLDIEFNEKILFVQWLHMTLDSGISLIESLRSFSKEDDSVLSAIARYVEKRLEEGRSISIAFETMPKIFSKAHLAILFAGEKSGNIASALMKVQRLMEEQQEAKMKMKKALMYPASLMSAMISLIFFMGLYIIPNVKSSIEIDYEQLPFISKIMFGASDLMCHSRSLTLVVVIVCVLMMFSKREFIKNFVLSRKMFKSVLIKQEISLSFGVISDLQENGVDLIAAMNCARDVCQIEEVKRWLHEVSTSIYVGSSNLPESKHVPRFVYVMLDAGIKSGNVPKAATTIFHAMRKEADFSINSIVAVISPVFIVLIGAMLGACILSIMIPLTNINF